MDHKTVQSLLSAFIDKELREEERILLEEHLSHCAQCRNEEMLLRKVSKEIVAVPKYVLPEGFSYRVLRSLRQEKERAEVRKSVEQFSRRVVLALSVTVIAFVTIGSLLQPAPPIVMDTYLSGESGDSLAARTLMTEGQLSKDEILLAAVIR